MIISESNYSERKIARDRISYNKSKYGLSYDVEFSLVKLLEKEIDLARAIGLLINDIKSRFDYNILDVYSAVQGYGDYITNEK